MHHYIILQHPGHNKVYYQQSINIAISELSLASKKFKHQLIDIEQKEIANIRYISFHYPEELSSTEIEIIAKQSYIFAFYKVLNKNNEALLKPITLPSWTYVDDKISSLLKYGGKTNELFTKMMVNVGLLASDFSYEDNINILDPIAGRGTTLYEAAIYGYNAYGVELDAKSVHDTNIFFKKFLEQEKLKHSTEKRKYTSKSKTQQPTMLAFEYTNDKLLFKDENKRKQFGVVNGNTIEAGLYFKKNKFHLIVGDLPYGVAHGNKKTSHHENITRSPLALITDALPSWDKILKKGGIIVLAWNVNVLAKHKVVSVLEKANYEELTSKETNCLNFLHKVDQSINRDIIIAKKK